MNGVRSGCVNLRGYTTEEIGKMLEVSDERVRAIILLLASTGLRPNIGF